ncbi:MAG: mannitol-1-phosphate 5-dehydrogenase [Candidatus Bathyarchaeota archaeon]|nr:mannitol-1-phosphate 5-dehydrogenase [Candidatus Bathyarchaeota archaeon]
MKIVVFGAGNIGRSLIGYIFSRAGYEVVFVDLIDEVVKALNERRRYEVVVRDVYSEVICVENVRAVHAKDLEKVSDEIASADVIATAVGTSNLPGVYETVAKGLIKRHSSGKGPIDILICENIRNASKLFREGLLKFLPKDYPFDSMVGLVETCIGKMVPLIPEEQRRKDILMVVAEAYDKIIVDAKAFKCGVPNVEGIIPKENITAYVDQKLFVHNMGHAVTAYLGYITDPRMRYIWEAISNPHVNKAVIKAMWESGEALIREYPDEFNRENMGEYIEDLIRRFSNRALGDTIYRVGRDLPRKLSRDDRLIGALLLEAKHSIPFFYTSLGVAAAILFRGKDENGKLYPSDEFFIREIYPRGVDYILEKICGLNAKKEKSIIDSIKKIYEIIVREPGEWYTIIDRM